MTSVIQEALQGSREVLITFKRDAIGEISYFIGMVQEGIVEPKHPMDFITLMAVSQSGDWSHDSNRTLDIILTSSFEEEWFVSRMERALESIEVISSTSSQKTKRSSVVLCQSCNGQMRPVIQEGCCTCNIQEYMDDLVTFDYTPVQTQRTGSLRKMKSPDGKTVREDAFGVEIDRLLSE